LPAVMASPIGNGRSVENQGETSTARAITPEIKATTMPIRAISRLTIREHFLRDRTRFQNYVDIRN